MDKLHLVELTTDIAVAEPGSNNMRSYFSSAAGFTLVYSPDTHLVHVAKTVNGVVRTRSIPLLRVRDFEIRAPEPPKAA